MSEISSSSGGEAVEGEECCSTAEAATSQIDEIAASASDAKHMPAALTCT